MRLSTRLFTLAVPILLAVLYPAATRATTPTRVFLGLNGNNANDCSNPATPCSSFAGALAQVATGGEVIIEATGGYGPLNVTKSVSINAAAGVVAFSAYTVTVNAPGAAVALRGLTIDGAGTSGNGIVVVNVGVLQVDSCVIANFNGNGILFGTSGATLLLSDTIIRGHSEFGIWIKPNSGIVESSIVHCRFEANQIGFFSESGVAATIVGSVFSGNWQQGAGVGVSVTSELNLEHCLVVNNGYALIADTGIIRVSNTTVTDNVTALSTLNGGLLVSRSNNTVENNFINGSFTGTFSAK